MINKSKLYNSFVLFIDILGFTNRVRNIKRTKDLLAIKRDIQSIRNELEYKKREFLDVHQFEKKRIMAFSDCIIISIAASSGRTKLEGEFDAIMNQFLGFALAQSTIVLKGQFLRGGLDLGWWYSSGDVLISSALTRAYELEKDANVPVIAISKKVYDFFNIHKDRFNYSSDEDPFPTMFRQYKNTKSRRLCHFIDYIKITLGELDWVNKIETREKYRYALSDNERAKLIQSGRKRNIISWLLEHKKVIINAVKRTTDSDILKKYEWLKKYHNQVCDECGIPKKCQI